MVKNLPVNAGAVKKYRFHPWAGKIPWSMAWQPTPVFLRGEFYGQRILAGYSPWGCKESDMTEILSTHMRIVHMLSPVFLPYFL